MKNNKIKNINVLLKKAKDISILCVKDEIKLQNNKKKTISQIQCSDIPFHF
jgi:hypothetical protein